MRVRWSIDTLPFSLLFFLAGILLARIVPPLLTEYLSFSGLLLFGAIIGWKREKLFFSFMLLFFLFSGIIRAQQYQKKGENDISRFRTKGPIVVQGIIINHPEEERNHALLRAESIVDSLVVWPVSGNLLLSFKGKQPPLKYGDWVRVKVIIEDLPKKEGFDYTAYLYRHRIYATATLKENEISLIGKKRVSLVKYGSFQLREGLKERIYRLVPREPQASLLSAVSFGLVRMRDQINEPFRKLGIYHLLVISGLHVSFLLLFLHLILAPLPLHPRIRTALYLPGILIYCVACGLAPPVVRASLMAGFYYLGIALNRSCKPIIAISFAAFLLLLINPFFLLEPGWQLTFGITLGLITGADKMAKYLKRLPGWLTKRISAALIGQVISAPLVAFHFGQVPLFSIIANLLFIPVSALMVLETFLAVLLGPLGFIFGAAAELTVTAFYRCAENLSQSPFISLKVMPGNYLYFLWYLPVSFLFFQRKNNKISENDQRDHYPDKGSRKGS